MANIESVEQYRNLLGQLCQRLVDTIPESENAKASADSLTHPVEVLQFGQAAVRVRLVTKTSGVDNYIVWLENGVAKFIREMQR